MKTFGFAILIILTTAQLAFCEQVSFKVGATIPAIIGVNYFPDSSTDKTNTSKDLIQEVVLRQGEKVLLESYIVK